MYTEYCDGQAYETEEAAELHAAFVAAIEAYILAFTAYEGWIVLSEYHAIRAEAPKFLPNDTLIILLVDRLSGSAAERFTSLVLSIENTLVIGQNTAGALLTNLGAQMQLPNSGIPFNIGSKIHLHPADGQFREGIGYAPDIWVIGAALTAALTMLDNMR